MAKFFPFTISHFCLCRRGAIPRRWPESPKFASVPEIGFLEIWPSEMYLRIRLWPSSVKNPRLRNCIFRFPEISGSGPWTLQFCKVPESKPELNSGFVPGRRFQHFQLSWPSSGLGPGLYPARKRERERERERESPAGGPGG